MNLDISADSCRVSALSLGSRTDWISSRSEELATYNNNNNIKHLFMTYLQAWIKIAYLDLLFL